jgi:tetraacyldisaccharide 4'-kinase
VSVAFRFERVLGDAREIGSGKAVPASGARVFAVAGIARPDRFFADLERAGWQIAGQRRFRDHHRYSPTDISEIAREARLASADVILMTEKDAVRWRPSGDGEMTAAYVPLRLTFESGFLPWLSGRIQGARRTHHH